MRPSFWVIAGGLLLFMAGLSAVLVSLPPHDLWWQLRTGQIIAWERRIPSVDRFSYTARGEPWLVQEWLADLLFHALQSTLGFDSLAALKIILMAVVMVAVAAAGRARGAPGLVALAGGALVMWAARPWMAIRPQLFSYALLAVFLAMLEAARRSRRTGPLIGLLPLTALWANLHSGALLAPVVLAIEAGGAVLDAWRSLYRPYQRVRSTGKNSRDDVAAPDETRHEGRASTELPSTEPATAKPASTPPASVYPSWLWPGCLAAAALGTALATLFTPFGTALWTYPGRVLGHPSVTGFITEWQSPDFHSPDLRPLAALIGVAVTAMIADGPRPPRRDFLLLGLLLAMGMLYKRNLPLFAVAAGPVLAGRLTEALEGQAWYRRMRWPWVGAAACLACLVPLSAAAPGWPQGGFFSSQAGMYDFPEGAVRYLTRYPPPGPIWNEYRWGGYLIWRLPQVPVFIDGRAEVYYRRGVFDDYVTVYRLSPGWRAVLARYRIRAIVAEGRLPVVQALQLDPAWRVVYRDRLAVVMERGPW